MVSQTSKSITASSFNHVGITLDNIEHGIDFYTRALGFRLIVGPLDIVPDDSHFGLLATDILGARLKRGQFAHLVGLNGVGLELFSFEDPEAGPRGEMEYWKNGFYHIALTTSDIDGMIARIEEAGGRRRTDTWEIFPGAGRYLAYAEDPFGNPIELYTHSYENTWSLAVQNAVETPDDGPVTLVVELNAKPDTISEALALTQNVIPNVLKEPSVQTIELFEDPSNPTRMLLIERWSSRAYVTSKAHTDNAHMSSYFSQIAPLLTDPPRWSVWKQNKQYIAS
ncbi:MAG: VOC family protein [Cyanobacteria bacterium P01_E01_bin.34]